MYKEIEKCRICGNPDLVPILNLGKQSLTGVFPKRKDQIITSGPLELVKCLEEKGNNFCGLVQLRHSYDLNELYGEDYGYRSGLNPSMVKHLQGKASNILNKVSILPGDLVIDIGSNDGTLLQSYPKKGLHLVGIDPTGKKFKGYYPDHIQLIPEFFSSASIKARFGAKKTKAITSIAMFYDLEDPIEFMEQIYEILSEDGIWIFEQSYMPTMLDMNAYDTICHEHLEYYGLKQIKWMTDRLGFKIIDVELNSINGGSFSVMVAKSNSPYHQNIGLLERVLQEEENKGLATLRPYEEFKQRVYNCRDELCKFVQKIIADRKALIGYGASTKGNVILQFCNLTEKEIPFIGEVNADKFGCYTPGTHIPIISETEAKALEPSYLLILPWHFKEFFVEKEREYVDSGGKLVFPLPVLHVVS